MHFISTRAEAGAPALSFSGAIRTGLAPDRGLYVPASDLPKLKAESFNPNWTLAETAAAVLSPLLKGDALAPDLAAICREAITFPAPLRQITKNTWLLELFHGPTAAFKDFGARFLARCLARD